MVSQNHGKDKGGRPEALDGAAKKAVRKSFALWLARTAKKHEVNHMTIRRLLSNERKAPAASTD